MKKVTLSKMEHRGESRIRVDFPYDSAIIQTIKQIKGSRWSQSKKCWHVPYSQVSYALLQKQFEVIVQQEEDLKTSVRNESHSSAKALPPAITPSLYQTIQKDGRVIKTVIGQKIIIEQENVEWLRLFVPYDKKGWIATIKNITGRQWNVDEKYWRIPYVKTSLTSLKKFIGMSYLDIQFPINPDIPDDFVLPQQHRQRKYRNSHFEQLNTVQREEVLKMVAKLELKRYSIWTIKSYKNNLSGFFLYYKNIAPPVITKDQLSKYLLHLIRFKKISESTQNSIISAVKSYWERVLERDKVWIDIIRPKKPQKKPNVLSTEEVIEMINVTENLKHKLLLLLLYSAGLRKSEVLNLLKKDINIKRRAIHVKGGKGKKDRYIVLAETVVTYLQDYLKQYRPSKWLFEGQQGGKYSGSSLQKVFEKAVELAQVNPYATIHTLRHSYATHCLEQGQNVKHVQEALGHSSIKTTEIYLHMTSDALNQLKSPLDNLKIK